MLRGKGYSPIVVRAFTCGLKRAAEEDSSRTPFMASILSQLSLVECEALAGMLEPACFEAGTVIVDILEPTSRLLVVVQGAIEVGRHGAVVDSLRAGDCFGERAVVDLEFVDDAAPGPTGAAKALPRGFQYTYTATEPTACVVVSALRASP